MNPQQIYKEAVESVSGNPEELRKLQVEADANQKNVEAWAQWRQLPQTQLFIDKLRITIQILSKLTASYCANVPGVDNNYIRARMVEANLLSEITDVTIQNGQLKEGLLKEYLS